MKNKTFIIFIIIGLVLTTFNINTNTVVSESWENEYGKLEVCPTISTNFVRQKQFYNMTWYYPDNDLDVAFRFNDSLSYGGVYFWNGTNYKKVEHNHIMHNNKHFYVVSNISFTQNVMKHGYWEYDILAGTSGKWDMFIKLSSDTWEYAFENDRLIHLDPWWNSGYTNYRQINIESAYIDNDLSDFPLLVPLDNSTGNFTFHNSGADIEFISMDNITQFNHEIDIFDNSGTTLCWVNIPETITSGTDYSFLVYYNNSDDITVNHNPTDVWNSNYLAVWHLNDLLDSTSNNIDLTNDGADSGATGKIGTCYDFEADDTDSLFHSTFLDGGFDVLSFECWVNHETDINATYISKRNIAGQDRFYFRRDGGNLNLFLEATNSGTKVVVGGAMIINNWYYGYGSYYKGTQLKIFLNTSPSLGDWQHNSFRTGIEDHFLIGKFNSVAGTNAMDGLIDEVRVSNIVRNDSWVNATFHSQNQSSHLGDFLYFGSEITQCIVTVVDIAYINNTIDINYLNVSDLHINMSSNCNYNWSIELLGLNVNGTNSIGVEHETLDVSSLNFSSDTVYIWYVNISNVHNAYTYWFRFTTIATDCPCENEFNVINYKLDMILEDIKEMGGNMFDETQFFIILMFAIWLYISKIGYEHNDTLLLYIQFFCAIPLVLYMFTVAFLDGIVLGYGVTISLLFASVYLVFLGTAFSYENRKKK